MSLYYSFLKDNNPPVFNPKVTPDPSESERLDEKLRNATEQLRGRYRQSFMRNARALRQPTA